jgi:uncharacterized protein
LKAANIIITGIDCLRRIRICQALKNKNAFLLLLAIISFAGCKQKENSTGANPKNKIAPIDSIERYIGEFASSAYKLEFLRKPKGWTNDFEGIFSANEVNELDSIITDFEKRTTIEIAILTIDSSIVKKDKFEEFVRGIGNYWGVGKKNINNGIIIGVSNGLKKIRIEYGVGLRHKLSDSILKEVLNINIIPAIKTKSVYHGVKNGLIELIKLTSVKKQ